MINEEEVDKETTDDIDAEEVVSESDNDRENYISLLQNEIKRLSAVSTHYQTKIAESKTSIKKKFYQKKLKKNNVQLMNMLIRMERLTK